MHASLRIITEAFQSETDACCGWQYCGTCSDDRIDIAFLCVLFKVTQINVQSSLIRELMLYVFILTANAAETAKIIFCMKGEYAVDQCTKARWLKKFRSGCKKPRRSNKVRQAENRFLLFFFFPKSCSRHGYKSDR